jgi:hypothetical protein
MPESSTGRGILPRVHDKQKEPLTYSRRKGYQRKQTTMILLELAKSSISMKEPKTATGIHNSPLTNIPCSLDNSNIDSIPHSVPNDELSDLDIPIAIRKPKHSCTSHLISRYLTYGNLSKTHKAFIYKISNLLVPKSIQEALGVSNWKSAVMEEMKALRRSGSWEVVDLPRGQKTIGYKWVFTVKCKVDGNIERYKARLVAKGFTQTYGIDYQEILVLLQRSTLYWFYYH